MIRCLFAFKGLILLTLVGIFLQTQPSVAAGPQQLLLSAANEEQKHAGQGEYYVKVNNGGNAYFARDSEDAGKPFILKYGEHK